MNRECKEVFERLNFIDDVMEELRKLDHPRVNMFIPAIDEAILEIHTELGDIEMMLDRAYTNEEDMLKRNIDYLCDGIDEMEHSYTTFLDHKHRYNNKLVSDFLEERIQEAQRRYKGTNRNDVTTYLKKLLNVDYNNYKNGIPSVLDLHANGSEYENKKTYVN